eukprot:TRINITY_DN15228_c0_g1::TRINITY_DN15228_c0_g1_i1::g.30866::m.30866 TRINITY_DN15228_c0_g1::TRINITY_DN15228_c0_g1_i1::g.30866  ORF type:complete len:569 (+),score=80.05 TRINITY_DN15228_c0_g1_i1:98-1804(+)
MQKMNTAETNRSEFILRGYVYGQLGNLAKMAVWWTALSPLVFATIGKSSAVGTARLAYNTALLVLSPLAGALCERVALKTILNMTTLSRMIIWGFLVPLAWWLFSSGLMEATTSETAMYAVLMALIFIDGIQVAFSNVVEMDCGGIDLLANAHGIAVEDSLRNRLNAIHEGSLNLSMVIFAPAIAVVSYYFGLELEKEDDENAEQLSQGGGIVGGIAFVYITLSLVSLYFYNTRIPTLPPRRTSSGEAVSFNMSGLMRDIYDGAKLCCIYPAIGWRLIFVAIETSLEDAMVAVIIAECALTLDQFGDEDAAMANIWGCILVSVGKTGSVLASMWMHRRWTPPTDIAGYRPLFLCSLVSGLSSVLMPVGLMVIDQGYDTLGVVIIFIGVFNFFLWSTGPKVGFSTLLQGLACEVDASGRIFGFVATFVTSMDSIVVIALSTMFQHMKHNDDDKHSGFLTALWIATGIYGLHGLLEVFFGPRLILQTSRSQMKESLLSDISRPSELGHRASSSLARYPALSTTSSIDTRTKSISEMQSHSRPMSFSNAIPPMTRTIFQEHIQPPVSASVP